MFDNSIVGSYGLQFWYISTIIQVYLFFPFLKILLAKVGNIPFFIICLAISLSYWIFVYLSGRGDLRIWNSSFVQYLWEISLGMIISANMRKGKTPFYKYNLSFYFVTAILGLGTMGFLSLKMKEMGRMFNDIPAFFGYISLCILLYKHTKKHFHIIVDSLVRIGSFSYS